MSFSVKTLCERWSCGRQHIGKLIATGELPAFNLGSDRRPTWRIPEESVLAFEAKRMATKPPQKPTRVKKQVAGQYY